MSVVESITNPKYVSADGSRIDCTVKFDTIPVPVPFTADANDVEPHGRAIHASILAGEAGPVADYVPPEPAVSQPPNVVG